LSSIQPALRDRMEIIDINGYTVEEKIQIAIKHLIPKQLDAHGLKKGEVIFNERIIEKIIEDYTAESGVRTLEKQIASVIRSTAKSVALQEKYDPKITEDRLRKILGAPIFQKEKSLDSGVAGVVTGLAWTPVGGDILFIETSLSRGKGKLTLTGNLGEVMKESASIALAYLKAHADQLKLDAALFDHWDIHIHVPEGATPKDGPSAGITMLTSLASAFTQRKIRKKMAMTGEITLRGKVLPVGGIKEKILAARRAGVTDIILSADNLKDVEEIPPMYLKGLKFHYVKEMIEVLNNALLNEKVRDAVKIDIPKIASNMITEVSESRKPKIAAKAKRK
ncbi:MAG: S16 family serine protease, partial [Bacteroidota bacterium]